MFHMYVGVRAGGGIGDEIEDPAGDESEFYRIIFDITFFFFVIVILLAIIQGTSHFIHSTFERESSSLLHEGDWGICYFDIKLFYFTFFQPLH